MTKKLKGVIPPIITPIDKKENVDEKGFRKLINHCIESGLHGIFVAGSNGETMGLTQKQRDRAIKITISEVKGRIPVLCGVMDAGTKKVIENIKRVEDMGGEIAVITPVFYARHDTKDETVRLFDEISNKTKIDLIIYNIPKFTGETLFADTIFRIAEIDKVIGYKDSSGNFADFIKCLSHFKNTDFVLLQGDTRLAAASLLLGADGYIPSMAPLFPDPFIKLYDYGKAGNIKETMFYDELVSIILSIFKCTKSQTTATKYAISRLGLCDGRVISPTEPILPEEAQEIDKKVEKIKQIISNETKNYNCKT